MHAAAMRSPPIPPVETTMDASLRTQVQQLLDKHRILRIATLRPDGWPQVTTVGYLNEGLTLYFMSGRESQKARNLARDNRVSLAIDEDTSDPMAICGLSMAALAEPVTDEGTIGRVLAMYPTKYPEYAAMMPNLELSGVAVFRLTPKVISVLDYTKGFGHAELTTVDPADLAVRRTPASNP
jgi:nitroimidazol reductase NimA-like FMN-containing flavoprotein (pyridoxamine 5'-phosphate oxidase superfamily)